MWRACALQMLGSWWRWKWGGTGHCVPTQTSLSCLLTHPHEWFNPHYMTQCEWVCNHCLWSGLSPVLHLCFYSRGWSALTEAHTCKGIPFHPPSTDQSSADRYFHHVEVTQTQIHQDFLYKSLFMLLWNNDQALEFRVHIACSFWSEQTCRHSFSILLPSSVNRVLESYWFNDFTYNPMKCYSKNMIYQQGTSLYLKKIYWFFKQE